MSTPEVTIPSGLFQTKPSSKNDRYGIYRMMNHMVTFRNPLNDEKVSGYVDEVFRDIFEMEIRLKIGSKTYKFKEPVAIRAGERDIVFCYGGVKPKEVTDDKVFDELRKEQFRETVDDTMKRLAPKRCSEIRFHVGAKRRMRKKPCLLRGIPFMEGEENK